MFGESYGLFWVDCFFNFSHREVPKCSDFHLHFTNVSNLAKRIRRVSMKCIFIHICLFLILTIQHTINVFKHTQHPRIQKQARTDFSNEKFSIRNFKANDVSVRFLCVHFI